MIRRTCSQMLVAAVLVLAACSSESATTPTTPSGPTGGWLTLQLSTPSTNDGALQLAVTGPGIDSVKLLGYDGFNTNNGSEADLVATGAISNGDIARIYVRDLTKTAAYHVTVSAAAARESFALQDVSNYRVVVVR